MSTYATTSRGAIGIRCPSDDGNVNTIALSQNLINRNTGTIIAGIQSDNGYATASAFTIVEIYIDDLNRWELRWEPSRIGFDMYWNGERYSASAAAPIAANTAYIVAGSWSPTSVRAFCGTMEETRKAGPVPAGNYPFTAYLGNNHFGTKPMSGILFNVAILKVPLTEGIYQYYEKFYRNYRLSDFIESRFRQLWYGGRKGKIRYRLGN